MKKYFMTLLLISTVLSSCSLFEDDEPIIFFEKHGNSTWERVEFNTNAIRYMKIANKPDNIAALFWETDQVCYYRDLYGNSFEINIGSNTEDYLEFDQKDAEGSEQDHVSLDIRNDTLIQRGYTGNAHGYYNWTRTWVRSKMNAEDLKSCD